MPRNADDTRRILASIERMLKDNPDDAFIVGFVKQTPDKYTVSINTDGAGIRHLVLLAKSLLEDTLENHAVTPTARLKILRAIDALGGALLGRLLRWRP